VKLSASLYVHTIFPNSLHMCYFDVLDGSTFYLHNNFIIFKIICMLSRKYKLVFIIYQSKIFVSIYGFTFSVLSNTFFNTINLIILINLLIF